MKLISRDRSELVPEGYCIGPEGIEPPWLEGRRIRVTHETHDGWSAVVVRVRQKGRIVDEMPSKWP